MADEKSPEKISATVQCEIAISTLSVGQYLCRPYLYNNYHVICSFHQQANKLDLAGKPYDHPNLCKEC